MTAQYQYSEGHILTLIERIREDQLSTPDGFFMTPVAELTACYNGIGPDSWSPALRSLTTRLLDLYEAEALIHDWEYTYQPRTSSAFLAANIRFARNAIRAAFRCRTIPPKLRLKRAACGVLLASLCQMFGWKGYLQTPQKIIGFTQNEN